MADLKEILQRIDNKEAKEGKDIKSFQRFIAALPKAEIHLHLEALVTAETLQQLNEKHGFYPECKTVKQLKEELDLDAIESLNEMIDQFLKIQSFFRKEEDFGLLTQHIPKYLKVNNIDYMEMHFSPSSFLRNGLDFQGMISHIEKEIDSICNGTNWDIRLIIDLSRTFGVENAMNNLNHVKKYLDSHKKTRIIAVGLGGAEKSGTPEEYHPVFAQAQKWKIRTVAHGGEDSGPEQLWSTLKELKPLRIGHGTCAFQDEKLMDHLKEQAIPLEICPTSNVVTGRFMKKVSEHPIRKFYDWGMNVTLNTDDPVIFGIELNDEYTNLYNELNFKLEELVQIIENTYNSSFMSDSAKKKATIALKETALKAAQEIYG